MNLLRFRLPACRSLASGALLTVALAAPLKADTYNWVGDGGNSYWTNPYNWTNGVPPMDLVNTDLVFGNSAYVNSTINQAYGIHSLTFSSNASAYTFSGQTLTLGAGGLIQNAVSAETFNAPLALGANQTWQLGSGSGALTFRGGVDTAGYALTLLPSTSGNTLAGAITGSGSLTVRGGGTVTLTGASTYTGATSVLGGTLSIASGGSLGNTTITVAPSANVTVTGSGVLSGANSSLLLDGVAGSPATATLSGTAALTCGSVIVGNKANSVGSITQSSGSLAVVAPSVLQNFILGNAAGSVGSYTLTGGSLAVGEAIIGYDGNGNFSQKGGTFTSPQHPHPRL